MKWKQRKGRKGGGREKKTKRNTETSITEIKTWFDLYFLFLQGRVGGRRKRKKKKVWSQFWGWWWQIPAAKPPSPQRMEREGESFARAEDTARWGKFKKYFFKERRRERERARKGGRGERNPSPALTGGACGARQPRGWAGGETRSRMAHTLKEDEEQKKKRGGGREGEGGRSAGATAMRLTSGERERREKGKIEKLDPPVPYESARNRGERRGCGEGWGEGMRGRMGRGGPGSRSHTPRRKPRPTSPECCSGPGRHRAPRPIPASPRPYHNLSKSWKSCLGCFVGFF